MVIEILDPPQPEIFGGMCIERAGARPLTTR